MCRVWDDNKVWDGLWIHGVLKLGKEIDAKTGVITKVNNLVEADLAEILGQIAEAKRIKNIKDIEQLKKMLNKEPPKVSDDPDKQKAHEKWAELGALPVEAKDRDKNDYRTDPLIPDGAELVEDREWGMYSDGSLDGKYTGSWKNNKPNGWGRFVDKKNHEIHEGQWKDGEYHGIMRLIANNKWYALWIHQNGVKVRTLEINGKAP